MASEEHEIDKETKEQLAQRSRWHLKQADEKRGYDAEAAKHHTELADELINKLCQQVLGKAEAYAKKAFGRKFELYEEAMVETIVLLDKALRNYTTRRGLEERFDATFHSIAVDAIRSVERANRRISDAPKDLELVSVDEAASHEDGSESYADLLKDGSSLDAYFEIIDRKALESIAHRLTGRQLQILTLYAEGHTFQEIADALNGINRETVSADYKRAIAIIKNNIAPHRGGETK